MESAHLGQLSMVFLKHVVNLLLLFEAQWDIISYHELLLKPRNDAYVVMCKLSVASPLIFRNIVKYNVISSHPINIGYILYRINLY